MEKQIIKLDINVKKPVSDVFLYISDIRNCAHPSVKVEEVIADEPIVVGTRFEIIGSLGDGERNWKSNNEIIAIEKDKFFSYTKIDPGYSPMFDVRYHYALSKSIWGTKLTRTVETVTSNIDVTTNQLKEDLKVIKKKIEQ